MPTKYKKEIYLLNNLGSKNCLLMKSGQFIPYYKRNSLLKNSAKTETRKLVPGAFMFGKN